MSVIDSTPVLTEKTNGTTTQSDEVEDVEEIVDLDPDEVASDNEDVLEGKEPGGVSNTVALLVSTASDSWDDVTATSLGVSPETKAAWDVCDAPIGAASGLRGSGDVRRSTISEIQEEVMRHSLTGSLSSVHSNHDREPETAAPDEEEEGFDPELVERLSVSSPPPSPSKPRISSVGSSLESGSLEIITGDNSPDVPPEQRPPRPLSSRCIPSKDSKDQSSLDVHEEEDERIRQGRPGSCGKHVQVESDAWRSKKKHVFALSVAGKPIYTRYGNEDELVTLFGVMQALVSFIKDDDDSLRCLVAGKHKFVFVNRDPLILVAVGQTRESTRQLALNLNYAYNQILSVLTLATLSRILNDKPNFDLRRLLAGSEKFIDSLLHRIETDPSILLCSVRCLPLAASVRDQISNAIASSCNKVGNLVFAILITNCGQLITMVRMKKYFLHPGDLHLIFNLVYSSESFKSAESWTPICLPRFDSGAFFHAHVSYVDEDSLQCCLLLLTVDRESFFTLSECKRKIVDKLCAASSSSSVSNIIDVLHLALKADHYSCAQVGISDLRHFLYKSKSTSQFTSPTIEAPYDDEQGRETLFGLYQYLHDRMHTPSRTLRILFHSGKDETVLGWMTAGFELYAVFEPLVTKPAIINAVNQLLKWIRKEEDRLFILNSPTF